MKKIEQYIFKTICQTIAVTIIALLSITVFFKLLDEQGNIGGNYTIWRASYYILLISPSLLQQIFPASCLLGSVLGLGILAHKNELVIFRSSGLSNLKIIYPVLLAVSLAVIINLFISEKIAPAGLQAAKLNKSIAKFSATTIDTQHGLWFKSKNNFVHVNYIIHPWQLSDVSIYQLNNDYLTSIGHAEQAIYKKNQWHLHNYQVSNINKANNKINHQHYQQLLWPNLINPHTVKILNINLEDLSIINLYKLINYCRNNQLDYVSYQLFFLKKLFNPIVTLIMVLMAIPLVFGNPRNINLSLRILLAAIIGLSYFLIDHLASNLILILHWPALLSVLIPLSIFGIVSLLLARN